MLNENWDSNSYADISTADLTNFKNLYDFNKSKNTSILDTKLKPNDHIIIRDYPTKNVQSFVTIEGAVFFPGKYSISGPNEMISDIIERAGGLRSNAYSTASKFFRDGEQINMSFEKLIKYPSSRSNINVRDGDLISVGFKPDLVKIVGAVNNPGSFRFVSGKTLLDYVEFAGGFTKDASRFSSFVTYPDGFSKKQSLLKFSQRLKMDQL